MENALAVAVLLFAPLAALAQAARVDAVQSPAWLERGGRAVALSPGTALEPNDKVVTGANARVRLKMAEGSAVRLGEKAQVVIERAEDRGLFKAVLQVLDGAFRYTTDPVSKTRPREVAIKVKHVSVGIRGTDVWGKSVEAQDLVCLLEGQVSVGSEGHPTVTLDRPRDFYRKPRGGTPEVASVGAEQLATWQKETAVDGEGEPIDGKGWRIVVATFVQRDPALKLVRALRGAGFAAEVSGAEKYTLVVINQMANEAQARAVMGNLRGLPGVELPKVVPMP